MSIRIKMLAVFMFVFTVFLLGVFFWFFQFSTGQMMNELRQNLIVSASTAAKMVNAEEHTRLAANEESDGADYQNIEAALQTVRDANPRARTIYTAIHSSSGNPNELMFVVELGEDALGTIYDASNAPAMLEAFDGATADAALRTDEYGVTLSGYAPIVDASGKAVAIIGVDMDASDVAAMQKQIAITSILVFIIAFASVFIVTILVSSAITKPLTKITGAAQILENDGPYDPKQLASVAQGKDELGILAHVFNKMAEQVYKRHEALKLEVRQLKIEIDQVKREKQVEEIVESDFFTDLKAKSETMRKRRSQENKE